jgi:hypothetical protein
MPHLCWFFKIHIFRLLFFLWRSIVPLFASWVAVCKLSTQLSLLVAWMQPIFCFKVLMALSGILSAQG